MAELVNSKLNERVIFPSSGQRLFLSKAADELNLSWTELAEKIGVNQRTLNDWKREKYSMPLRIVRILSHRANIPIPANIKIKDQYWYTTLGSPAGARAVLKKYGRVGGDPEYRKKRWCEWWRKKGRYKKHSIIGVSKPIRKPNFSKELAEFTGIMMGDGGITKYQVTITVNKKDDRDYAFFVKRLIAKMFGVPVSIRYSDDQSMRLIISRVELVNFCKEKLGLKIGNKLKQGLDVPNWIKKNTGFQKSCLRGLIDTDGCVFDERHRIKNKIYSYKRLNFTSYSPALRKSVFIIFKRLNMVPKIRNDRCVQIENKEEIAKYFEIIGTHNLKHKYRFFGGVGSGCPK